MTSKLSRFLHLERARTGRPESETSSPVQSGGRFEDPQERRETQEADVPEAHLERFKGQPPVGLADVPEDDVRRFPRCMLCESENGRFAQACGVCGADLGTPEQLEFNERLWQERKKGLSRTIEDEAEALRQLEARRREDAEHFNRQLEKLRAEEGSYRWMRVFARHSTVGTALLALLPHPLLKGLMLATLIALPVGLWRYGHGLTKLGGLVLGLFFLSLFFPGRSYGRH
ncbi:hypothetical protein [Pyxidicoccus trucidator]|uniref:hypothetical protein n=1 Tax=Pyxidicoccus trucidator TaxID=2709662 RepID=UPI0013DB6F79|nr:hypothetical protein [Pyxidicoccus trucidator]